VAKHNLTFESCAKKRNEQFEVSLPPHRPDTRRFLQRECKVCEGLGASPCKDLLKAPAIHLDLYKAPAADWSGSRRLTAKSEFSLSGPLFFM